MFDFMEMFADTEGLGVDSYTAEGIMAPGGPQPGNPGMQQLEQAMAPQQGPDVMPGPSGYGQNQATAPNPAQAMMPGQNQPDLPQPGGTGMPGKPVAVDEVQMARHGGDAMAAWQAAGGRPGGGNLAASLGSAARMGTDALAAYYTGGMSEYFM